MSVEFSFSSHYCHNRSAIARGGGVMIKYLPGNLPTLGEHNRDILEMLTSRSY